MKFKVFLWILLRDHLTVGQLEEILVEHIEKIGTADPVFDDVNFEALVDAFAERLR